MSENPQISWTLTGVAAPEAMAFIASEKGRSRVSPATITIPRPLTAAASVREADDESYLSDGGTVYSGAPFHYFIDPPVNSCDLLRISKEPRLRTRSNPGGFVYLGSTAKGLTPHSPKFRVGPTKPPARRSR